MQLTGGPNVTILVMIAAFHAIPIVMAVVMQVALAVAYQAVIATVMATVIHAIAAATAAATYVLAVVPQALHHSAEQAEALLVPKQRLESPLLFCWQCSEASF